LGERGIKVTDLEVGIGGLLDETTEGERLLREGGGPLDEETEGERVPREGGGLLDEATEGERVCREGRGLTPYGQGETGHQLEEGLEAVVENLHWAAAGRNWYQEAAPCWRQEVAAVREERSQCSPAARRADGFGACWDQGTSSSWRRRPWGVVLVGECCPGKEGSRRHRMPWQESEICHGGGPCSIVASPPRLHRNGPCGGLGTWISSPWSPCLWHHPRLLACLCCLGRGNPWPS
jgi:hypothetical protein